MLPVILYSVWVSQQPVWINFSRTHQPVDHNWAIGFFLLWVLAGAGIGVLGSRVLRSPFAFLATWAIGSAGLLLVLNGYLYPKMTYGCTIALAVLAGVAVDEYRERLPARWRSAAVAAVAFAALASPLVMISKHARAQGTTVSSELFQVIAAIRSDTICPSPAVLADCDTGVMLPGLSGYRVFCGHWSLTENNRQKIVLLAKLGFLAEGQTMPRFSGVGDAEVVSGAALLRDEIASNTFQYFVVQKSYRVYTKFSSVAPQCMVHSGPQYLVLRMCPEVKTLLKGMLALGPDLSALSRRESHSTASHANGPPGISGQRLSLEGRKTGDAYAVTYPELVSLDPTSADSSIPLAKAK
jgi:hypothetical protein